MPIEFDIKLKAKDLFRFNMYQTDPGFAQAPIFLPSSLVSSGEKVSYIVSFINKVCLSLYIFNRYFHSHAKFWKLTYRQLC